MKCLLISPNPDSALNPEAGRLLQEAYDDYASTAKLWTGVHAANPRVAALFAVGGEEEERIAAPLGESGASNAATQLLAASTVKPAPVKKATTGVKRGLKRL